MSETPGPVATELDQRRLAEQLLARTKEQRVELVGPLDPEMTEHLGY